MNPSNGSCFLKLFSKGDQLKIKLTSLKFPENDKLDLFLLIGRARKYEEGISMGAKETGGQLGLWDCGFYLDAIFDPFLDDRKRLQNEGVLGS